MGGLARAVCALLAVVLAALVPLSPASAQPGPVPSTAAAKGPDAVATADADYRLGVADKIRVLVFNEPTLSGEFVVNANGAVSAPLIGDVAAAGRTTTQLRTDIEDKLRGRYLRDPHVSIDVLTFRPYYILGEVNKPGEYPYSSSLTVMNAVATAEGFTHRANKRRVYIKHAGEEKEQAVPLTSNLPVLPGDTIRFGERYF